MKTDMNKLRGKIVERQASLEKIADTIGINRSTFYRKMKANGMKFSIEEAHKIVSAVPLTQEEAIQIFLAN